ncbi:MAG TPA: TIM-barrel domain-containing protein [Longimicrobiaceae bacterium]|nr:TIM-barrel domain-containing protein [Longimicrobiaceae bacterium]
MRYLPPSASRGALAMTGVVALVFFLLLLLPVRALGQHVRGYARHSDGVSVQLGAGTLQIRPLAENAVRIRYGYDGVNRSPELILTEHVRTPRFRVTTSDSAIVVSTSQLKVLVDKRTGALTYADRSGEPFLREIPGSRVLSPDSVDGEKAYVAAQGFRSPADEALFGLGQFQDGNFDLRGVSRRLTQVNSQISIPFVYSTRGYGLLWHQYGLTEFNPADHYVALELRADSGQDPAGLADVTTSAGTRRRVQGQSRYTGTFRVPADGDYSILLDLGDMGNRQYVAIDGKPVIDAQNLWLPPTASATVHLGAGEHGIQVVSKASNHPRVSWRLVDDATVFRSPAARALDYVVFYGPSADRVISTFRSLSGRVPMLPLWAFGFWQCRERYTSAAELVGAVEEFRRRRIPMDVIVQDWQYWPRSDWGVPEFDAGRYPDPDAFIRKIHDLDAHFVISVWENPGKDSEIGRRYAERGLFIPGSPWVDVFNPEARKAHWNVLDENLFAHGVDGWWMDATEPENDALHGRTTYLGPGDFYRLTYPLFVSRAVYEGQREVTEKKRVVILTRSAFAGQQRYGTINWSGDVNGTWDSYRRQIVAGLDYALTGMPYWTTDIGGFFRPGRSQYTDPAYRELLIRWFQWGALNPVFRIHGYQSETEIWKYGPTVEADARRMLDLRYRLMPYIYSGAWRVSSKGSTPMRPLVMDFRTDARAVAQRYEYMFGPSLLVAPVTEPGVTERDVYLPAASGWYDFWTGRRYPGGRSIRAAAPLSLIPLFVRAGSIVPMGDFVQSTREEPTDTLEIRVYPGADGTFELYEDEGDGYGYEHGAYSVIPFEWNESRQTLTIGKRRGSFAGMRKDRVFEVVWVDGSNGAGIGKSEKPRTVRYRGARTEVGKDDECCGERSPA